MRNDARYALVTGAGSGIGRATAVALSQRGFRLVLTGRRREALVETADLLADSALICPANLTEEDQVENVFAIVKEQLPRLDFLFNNAGVNVTPTPFEDFSLSDWRKVLDSNLTSAFLCARSAFRQMKDQDPQGGRILNNGSVSATAPRPYAVAYTCSKHGMSGLTKTISLEGRRFNIVCGQIDIGNTVTAVAAQIPRGMMQADFNIRPEPTFDVQYVAESVAHIADLPLDVNVQSVTLIASAMPYIGRG